MVTTQRELALPPDDEIDLRQYLGALWRRRWTILFAIAVALVAAYVATRTATPIYEASATVLIQKSASSQIPLGDAIPVSLFGGRPALQNYVELLKSRTVMERTVAMMAPETGWGPNDVERLRRAVSVQPVANTDTIRLQVRLPDPVQAQQLANALVKSFAEVSQEMNRTEARSARDFIEDQLKVVREQLAASENALLVYKRDKGVVAPSEEARAAVDKLADLEKMQASTQVSIQETSTRTDRLRAQLHKQNETIVTSTTISNNPLIQNYKVRLADLEVRLSGALEHLAPQHPEVVALKAEIQEVRRRMGEEVERIVSAQTQSLNPIYQTLAQQLIGLEVEQLALQARAQALQELVKRAQTQLAAMPSQELDLARLEREQKVNEEVYVLLRTRYEEIRIQEAMATADVRVVDLAPLPRVPVSPRPVLNLAVALFLGLFLGVGISFVLEFIDTTIKTDDEVERVLGVPVLGRIPEFSLAGGGSARGRRRRRPLGLGGVGRG